MVYFNPLNKYYKSITGAICAEKKVTFRVKGSFDSVVLLLKKDGFSNDMCFEMVKKDDHFEVSISLEKGLYFYCFALDNGKFLGLGDDFNGVVSDEPTRYQLTVYQKDYSVPEWIKGGIIYQIFPDRFCRAEKEKNLPKDKILHENWAETPVYEPNKLGQVVNNDFFGGDLKGIISKLDYLRELGVTVIYLNPIFKAYSNHRYDTGNYMEIDPLLGTESDFEKLISTASEKGIKIILDGVFNHTGDDSLYFNRYKKYPAVGAYQSKNSEYYGWYKFKKYPNDYESWWGIKILPATNKSNQGFIDYITGENGVIDKYTKMGIGGWRLDVVDELPTPFVQKIRTATKRVNKDAIVIGEVWEDATNKISYDVRREYFQGKELDSVMNYPLKDAIIDFAKNNNSKNLVNVINEQVDHYPHDALHALMNVLATHDSYRLLSSLNCESVIGKKKSELENVYIREENLFDIKLKLKVATLLAYTLCGVPSIYYGDEVGMQGYDDPLNRRTYPWGKEDIELLEWHKFLSRIRHGYSAFKDGEIEVLYYNRGALVYKREDEKSSVLIAVNLNDNELMLEYSGSLTNLIDNKKYDDIIQLKSKSFAILVNKG